MKSWLIVANNAEFDRRNLCGAARGGWRAHYFALSTRGERPFADRTMDKLSYENGNPANAGSFCFFDRTEPASAAASMAADRLKPSGTVTVGIADNGFATSQARACTHNAS
jgi:hypothetical protein